MISINNQYNPYRMNNTAFKANLRSECSYLGDCAKGVAIYQLEQKETSYIKYILKNLGRFFKKFDVDNMSARQVLEEALNAGVAILNADNPPEKKARFLMSFYNNEPSSILIGNVLKIDKNGKFHYSSRKEHGENETELDWLATWNKEIPGEGQATVYDYFDTLKDDGFDACAVRSELPEKSSAVKFYTRMGFHKISEVPHEILREGDYGYVIGKYDDKADEIIPMLATAEDIERVLREKADIMKRHEIKDKSSCALPPLSL